MVVARNPQAEDCLTSGAAYESGSRPDLWPAYCFEEFLMIGSLATVLSAMIQDESSFARCEALYAESFKCATPFTVADGVYPRDQLVQFLMEPIYRPESCKGVEAPALLEDEDFEEFDRWDESVLEPEILKPGMTQTDADAVVDQLHFVELCNYKGEGEGFTLACRAAHLRVFISKFDYLAA
jgi:hypothetical protein